MIVGFAKKDRTLQKIDRDTALLYYLNGYKLGVKKFALLRIVMKKPTYFLDSIFRFHVLEVPEIPY